ncbi:uncharacterized protein LOC110698831 [Chenopodium quinoa]|uniref:uncharacterized protein LOC110698831 n=1 Tax=Chenopodium quinoa TaxID=63459 RepID=UPI000B78B9C9|nr:uncharacterized protein LOC110698831 [Chenopodium quinoa]
MIYVSDKGRSEKILGSQKEARRCNHLKPSKSRRNDKDDEEEKEKDRGTKRPKGLSASAQGSPVKKTSLGKEKASSSSEPKDSGSQPKSGKPTDIDSRPESDESSARAMELDNQTESIPLTEGDDEKCVHLYSLRQGIAFLQSAQTPKIKRAHLEDEQKQAFQQLREHLAHLPTPASPTDRETLYLYVAVCPATISAVFLREKEKIQQSIYFVSHTLTDAETRHPLLEKVAYAVVIRGEYEAKEPSMVSYLAKIKTVIVKLRSFEAELIPRGHQADALSKLASSSLTELNRSVYVEVRRERSVDQEPEVHHLQRGAPEEIIPSPTIEVRGSNRCRLHPLGNSFRHLREPYRGKNFSPKALREGFYWPTMIQDAKELVKKCEKCQTFAPVIRQPSRDLQPILNPLPFAQWGLDISGPFPDAPYQERWLIVGIDYFSKWIEAESSSNITEQIVREFIWQNIITRFRIPKVLLFNRGRQFDNLPLKRYTNHFGIKLAYSAVCHPQSNGQAEAANKQILNALKKRVEDQNSKWIEELPGIL